MKRLVTAVCAGALGLPAWGLPPLQGPTAVEGPAKAAYFPPSTPLDEGISPQAVGKLTELVQSFIDAEEAVGAELLVVVNGKTIHHGSYGWSDLEGKVPMETGSVFCVRSMTKPLIGTAILMLEGDRKLKLSDKVSEYLPALDVEGWQDITLEHLITHTSGLPFSLIAASPPDGLGDIQKVAALGADYELDFEPGTKFQYSDQGTDTLTAVIEVVTGMPAADFVRTRILEPLEMRSSTCVMAEEHPLRPRALPAYIGGTSQWKRFWGPDQPPLFPFFLGSQGLYSTVEDYAKFLDMWRRKGRGPSGRILKTSKVKRGLTPTGLPFGAGSGFLGLETEYGCLMETWTRQVEGQKKELVAFGHNGSDGTYAWAFPKQKALVMYFTQSRNNPTGLRVEEALGNMFLGTPFDPNQLAPPLDQYLGYYQENEPDLYRAIIRDGDGLALEIRGKGVVALAYAGGDRFKFRDNPNRVVEFDRGEDGSVTGYHIGKKNVEYRFEPAADLPTVDEVTRRVAKAHGLSSMANLGGVRIRAKIEIKNVNLTGDATSLLAWPDKFRFDSLMGPTRERAAFDGKDVRYALGDAAPAKLQGERADAMRVDHIFARLGDLKRWHPTLRVIERLHKDGEEIILLRTGDLIGPANTLYVHWPSGRVVMADSVIIAEGMGRIAQRQEFSDYREVSGMTLPYRTEVQVPNPVVGTIVVTIEEVEVDVEIPGSTFRIED